VTNENVQGDARKAAEDQEDDCDHKEDSDPVRFRLFFFILLRALFAHGHLFFFLVLALARRVLGLLNFSESIFP
jgi:hypothetical protein